MKTISYDKIDIDTLLDIKTFSNIELIKCFKLTFSKYGIKNNYGSIIIIIMITIFISLILIYNINQKKYISKILVNALNLNKIRNPMKKKYFKVRYNSKTMKETSDNNIQSKYQSIKDLINISPIKVNKQKKKKVTLKIKNYKNINIIKSTNIILKQGKKKFKSEFHKRKNKVNIKNKGYDIRLYPYKRKNDKKKLLSNEHTNLEYNDLELNNLLYEEALLIDKRSYWQFYWSLIKTKHIFLMICIAKNDYNLITIKIALFIFNFGLYFTLNALFFTDKTMHKIYEEKGFFNITNQLPHILYSSSISIFLNIFIKTLALSGKNIIELKRIKNKKETLQKTCKVYRTLNIRFNFFFGISFFFLLFFWYYISTFCAVYKNTQIIFICNTLLCFGFTLCYPFILNLFPGIFRIPSLKSNTKDKQCLYTIGNILSLI